MHVLDLRFILNLFRVEKEPHSKNWGYEGFAHWVRVASSRLRTLSQASVGLHCHVHVTDQLSSRPLVEWRERV